MELPADLQVALQGALRGKAIASLAETAAALSACYRASHGRGDGPLARSAGEALAYAAYRMPATFAAIFSALQATQRRLPSFAPLSMLDLGAGSGAALWAASGCFDSLQQAQLFEGEAAMLALGKTLAAQSLAPVVRAASWAKADLLAAPLALPEVDLVTCAYVLGELGASARTTLLSNMWQATRGVLLLVEPGTPRGFAIIRALRAELIAIGAHIAAPCPHVDVCPMPTDDWCHFAQRIARPSFQRTLKGATLGYEDEKFSYIAATRLPPAALEARIIRHPQVRSGTIELELCTQAGTLVSPTITKRNKDSWRAARDAAWGGEWGGNFASPLSGKIINYNLPFIIALGRSIEPYVWGVVGSFAAHNTPNKAQSLCSSL
ncbi:rRNA methyltransferase [Candidatus Gracilibacteria bacterium]|nr:rRNA methyltransferase [Candidatus Gracilibacteria bacterium]